jgi:hypothetical protein
MVVDEMTEKFSHKVLEILSFKNGMCPKTHLRRPGRNEVMIISPASPTCL